MTDKKFELREMLAGRPSRDEIARFLNDLAPHHRMVASLAISGSMLRHLYETVSGAPALTPSDFVPAALATDQEVIFEGKNSLPVFSRFQKRFARTPSSQVVGYNHQSLAFATGPGFFVVCDANEKADVADELYFDYTLVPKQTPSSWPAYRSNGAGLSRLVYQHMKDYMRSVASGVCVGVAYKLGQSQKQYFLLCRSAPES